MEFPSWLNFFLAILPHVARAVIEGSRAAGVTHDTVAKTIATAALHLLDGVQQQRAAPIQTPGPPLVPQQ